MKFVQWMLEELPLTLETEDCDTATCSGEITWVAGGEHMVACDVVTTACSIGHLHGVGHNCCR